MILPALDFVVRIVIITALLYTCIVALTSWAVRARHLNPFGPWPRLVRRASDPLLRQVERRVVQTGGNPQDAPLWLIGIVVVGGLVVLSLTRWLTHQFEGLASADSRTWLRMLVGTTFSIIMAALFVRVISSWFGISRYRRWMRPIFVLTDWLVEPVRRILPPVGIVDFSPLVAWLILILLRGFILGLIT